MQHAPWSMATRSDPSPPCRPGEGGPATVTEMSSDRRLGPTMVILALDWYIWVALGLLFAYALVRRLWRSWRLRRRARAPRAATARYGSKRP